MKFVIQKVTHASVTVDEQVIGKIGKGFLVLIGVAEDDTKAIADKLIKKLLGLRIFEDADGKQVSQFEFAEDPLVKQEFLKLDYNLADLCS